MDHFSQTFERIATWWYELNFTSVQKRALLIGAALVIFISALLVIRGNTHSITAPPIIPAEIAAPEIFVDVTGAVNNPGVYTLSARARVIDAIKAAGDSAPGADLSTINLARVLADGEQVYVDSTISTPSKSKSLRASPAGPLNINRATASQFDALDGIGPVIAARIIAYRKSNGPFTTIEELQKVSGIGAAKFAQFKSKIRV